MEIASVGPWVSGFHACYFSILMKRYMRRYMRSASVVVVKRVGKNEGLIISMENVCGRLIYSRLPRGLPPM